MYVVVFFGYPPTSHRPRLLRNPTRVPTFPGRVPGYGGGEVHIERLWPSGLEAPIDVWYEAGDPRWWERGGTCAGGKRVENEA